MPSETQKIPHPIYAAAGAGDIAIERLRKLPERVAALQEELPGRLSVIGDKVTQKVAEIPSLVAELRQRVIDSDTEKLREAARRNATVLRTSAQNVSEKAAAIYSELVARGEAVLSGANGGSERVHAEIIVAGEEAEFAKDDYRDADLGDADADEAGFSAAGGEAAAPKAAKPAPKKAAGKPRKAG